MVQDIIQRIRLSAELRNAKRQKLSTEQTQKIANDLVRAGYPLSRMSQDLAVAGFSASEIKPILDGAYPSGS